MLATVKIDLPQELATRLQPVEDQLPRILELGLRELGSYAIYGF